MDAEVRQEAAQLRQMGSQEAADYLIEHLSANGWQAARALILVQHVSWSPGDQVRLARHFLARHPQASSRPLEAFASFMSFKNFAEVVSEVWPTDQGDADLFRYYLGGVLTKYETCAENKTAIAALLASKA